MTTKLWTFKMMILFSSKRKNVNEEIPLPLAKELNWLLTIMKLEVGCLKWKVPNWK